MDIDGILLYVSNLGESLNFYSKLGFIVEKSSEDMFSINSGHIKLQFLHNASVPELTRKDIDYKAQKTFFIYIHEEDVDKKFREITEAGLQTSGEPRDWPWSNREFSIKDPDGYVLVFYSKFNSRD